MSHALEQARIRAVLNKRLNYGGEIMSRREFVEQAAARGDKAEIVTLQGRRGAAITTWLIGNYQATQIEVDYLRTLQEQEGQP